MVWKCICLEDATLVHHAHLTSIGMFYATIILMAWIVVLFYNCTYREILGPHPQSRTQSPSPSSESVNSTMGSSSLGWLEQVCSLHDLVHLQVSNCNTALGAGEPLIHWLQLFWYDHQSATLNIVWAVPWCFDSSGIYFFFWQNIQWSSSSRGISRWSSCKLFRRLNRGSFFGDWVQELLHGEYATAFPMVLNWGDLSLTQASGKGQNWGMLPDLCCLQ